MRMRLGMTLCGALLISTPLVGASDLPCDGPDGHNRAFFVENVGRFPAGTEPVGTSSTGLRLTGDLDHDGDLDIVVLGRGQERVLINDGLGFFHDETAQRFPQTSDSTRSGALADLDGDGSLDLVTSNSRGEPPRLYANLHGVFLEREFPYAEGADETDTSLELVDLNGDRYPDLYIGNAGKFDSGHGFEGGPDHFFENQRGHFVEATARHARFPAEQASTAAAFGDLDGDGDVDLIVAGTGDGDVGRERVFVQTSPK